MSGLQIIVVIIILIIYLIYTFINKVIDFLNPFNLIGNIGSGLGI